MREIARFARRSSALFPLIESPRSLKVICSMKASDYRFLLWQLIAAADTGDFDKLSIEDVRLHARGGTTSKFLQETFRKVADFSIFKDEDWKAIDRDFGDMENAIDASRKFEVENRGLALLMAWTLEGVQRG